MATLIKPVYIESTDIPDAWFSCIAAVLDYGFSYEIQHGSYVGQTRYEMDWITCYIKYPQTRPLEPEVPQGLGIPNPVEPGYIESYVPYLMTPHKEPNEDYTYGSRIAGHSWYEDVTYDKDKMAFNKKTVDQIHHFIELLKKTPNTNQAILQVAQPQDCMLNDPPCLRHIDMRVRDGKLIFYPYFRSWDLWNGFPANLGGIVYLQEYMAEAIGVDVGPFICSSKGLHIYGYAIELAKLRRNPTNANISSNNRL